MASRWRWSLTRLTLVGTLALTAIAVGVSGAGAAQAVHSAIAVSAAATGGAGAPLPYVELQAENAATTGTVIGPSASGVTYGTLQDEASFRKAVKLTGGGQYVEFTTTAPTNSIVFRYSIPDTGDGSAYTAPLSLYINGTRQPDFTLTNKYSWLYSGYPFTNSPGSNPHWFYDELHRLFSTTYPAGTKFRLQADTLGAASYTIDFADFEQVGAPLGQPAGSVSVTSKGADATGVNDSTSAFQQAVSAAGAGGTVYIPQGTFKVTSHIAVNNVTVTGAGMWYSNVQGPGVGFYGNFAPTPSANVHMSNFLITGDVQDRCDSCQVNGIGGAFNNSTFDHIWIEHEKVGAWLDGPFDGTTLSYMRIRDTTADGVNFHGGVTHSTVTNSDIRNTGDDGLATWADTSEGADAFDTFSNNTVSDQILANGIAIYGGHDNTVSGNKVVDTGLAQGGGIHVAQRFSSTALGLTTVTNNTMIRDGSLDPNWQFGVGALWFDARDGAMTGPVNVDNFVIQQSPYEAIQTVSGSTVGPINLSNGSITGAGTYIVQGQTGGALKFTNVSASGWAATHAVYNCAATLTITDGGGNGTWVNDVDSTHCGSWPTPVWPPYQPEGNVSISPTSLSFGSRATGTTSPAQAVTIANNGTASQSIAVGISGDYAQTNNCGSSLAVNASCTINVTFSPTATGTRNGTLTVTIAGTANPVSLTGTGVAPGPNLSANPTSLSFPSTVVGNTSAAQTTTITNGGTAAATISSIAATGDFSQTNTCGTSLAVNATCTISVRFAPTTGGARTGSVTITSNAVNSPTTISLSGSGIGTNTNIALGQPASASSSVNAAQTPNFAVDGDANTYWESANGAFPQWLQVDLGTSFSINKVVLKLPPSTAWGARNQTLSVQGSTDGSSFSTLASGTYTFDPNVNANSVTITFTAATERYVRINITANTGWAAGQVSELEVYPSGSGGTSATLSVNPSSLTFGSTTVGSTSAAQSVTVQNTGTAAASVSSIAASGDFAQTNTCGTSIAAGASCSVSVTFHPTATGTRTGSVTITSNATNSPSTVSLTGTGASGATATLTTSPSSLTFASTTVGSTSAAQSVTVQNTGTAAASVSSIAASGDFAQTNTCGTSIAAGASCSVSVTFHPTASGTRTGSLTITSNATNSPSTVSLTGTGAGTTISATSTIQAESWTTMSGVQTETTTDTGGGLNVGWIANGDWIEYDNVDFGSTGLNQIQARVASGAAAGVTGNLEVHLDSRTNAAVATLAMSPTGGWQTWQTNSAAMSAVTGVHTVFLVFTSGQGGDFMNINWFTFAKTTTNTNLALGKTMSASSSVNGAQTPNFANDGNTSSYWESANNAFPQWLQVDLGASTSVSRLVLTLPPSTSWGARTQTLSVLGSNDGTSFTTVKASAGYTFDPNTGNTVTITFTAASWRYWRLNFTANTGWPAGQVSEFQVWAS